MAGVFRRLFGKARDRESIDPVEPHHDIEAMSVSEIGNLLRSLPQSATVGPLIDVYKRLFEIAWFEHGITNEERSAAQALAEAVRSDIQNALAHDKQALNGFLEAADAHADGVMFYGFGSLQWITEEQGVSAAELIPFCCQPEFRELLPTYLTMLDETVLPEVRQAFLQSLIRLRRVSPEQSDVRVLSGLMQSDNRALEILLRPEEFAIMRNVQQDQEGYEAAERFVALIMHS